MTVTKPHELTPKGRGQRGTLSRGAVSKASQGSNFKKDHTFGYFLDCGKNTYYEIYPLNKNLNAQHSVIN